MPKAQNHTALILKKAQLLQSLVVSFATATVATIACVQHIFQMLTVYDEPFTLLKQFLLFFLVLVLK